MEKSKLIFNLSIWMMSMSLFSCRNDKPINTNTIIEKNRKIDSTKVAFRNIEFGMNSKELIELGIFDNSQKEKTNSAMTMSIKTQETSFSFDKKQYNNIINPTQIISNDVVSFTKVETIGKYKYIIGVSLYKDKLFILYISINHNDDVSDVELVKNLVDLVSIKYGKPQIERKLIDLYSDEWRKTTKGKSDDEITKPLVKYEWLTKHKTIRIYEKLERIYLNKPQIGLDGELHSSYLVTRQSMEFYNDSSFVPIFKNCKHTIDKIIKKKEMKKLNDSKDF